MIPEAAVVRQTPADRAVLEAQIRALTTEQRAVFRARIVLLADEGRSTRSIAHMLGTMPRTVSTWRGRFVRDKGLVGQQTASRASAYLRCRDRSPHYGGIGSGAAGRICALTRIVDCN